MLLACIVFLAIIFSAQSAMIRRAVLRNKCNANLNALGAWFSADDINGRDNYLPWTISAARGGTLEFVTSNCMTYKHFTAMSSYLVSPKILVCPTDSRTNASSWQEMSDWNLSYFVGVGSRRSEPSSVLAGDRNLRHLTNQSGGFRWEEKRMHGRFGNVLRADGSVHDLIDDDTVTQIMDEPCNRTNRLIFPCFE